MLKNKFLFYSFVIFIYYIIYKMNGNDPTTDDLINNPEMANMNVPG